MKVYKLTRDEANVGYDEAAGFVITAGTVEQARRLASQNAGDEGGAVWLDGDQHEIKRIGVNPDDQPKVELRDFKNG